MLCIIYLYKMCVGLRILQLNGFYPSCVCVCVCVCVCARASTTDLSSSVVLLFRCCWHFPEKPTSKRVCPPNERGSGDHTHWYYGNPPGRTDCHGDNSLATDSSRPPGEIKFVNHTHKNSNHAHNYQLLSSHAHKSQATPTILKPRPPGPPRCV